MSAAVPACSGLAVRLGLPRVWLPPRRGLQTQACSQGVVRGFPSAGIHAHGISEYEITHSPEVIDLTINQKLPDELFRKRTFWLLVAQGTEPPCRVFLTDIS